MIGTGQVVASAPHVTLVGGRGIDDALNGQPRDHCAGESWRLVERGLPVDRHLEVVTHVANYAPRCTACGRPDPTARSRSITSGSWHGADVSWERLPRAITWPKFMVI